MGGAHPMRSRTRTAGGAGGFEAPGLGGPSSTCKTPQETLTPSSSAPAPALGRTPQGEPTSSSGPAPHPAGPAFLPWRLPPSLLLLLIAFLPAVPGDAVADNASSLEMKQREVPDQVPGQVERVDPRRASGEGHGRWPHPVPLLQRAPVEEHPQRLHRAEERALGGKGAHAYGRVRQLESDLSQALASSSPSPSPAKSNTSHPGPLPFTGGHKERELDGDEGQEQRQRNEERGGGAKRVPAHASSVLLQKASSKRRGAKATRTHQGADAATDAAADADAGLLQAEIGQLQEDLDLSHPAKRITLNMLDSFSAQNRQRFSCSRGLHDQEAFAALPPCPAFLPCSAVLTSKTKESPAALLEGQELANQRAFAACSAGIADAPGLYLPMPPLNCRAWYGMDGQKKEALVQPLLRRSLGDRALAESELLRRRPSLGCAHRNDFIPELPVAFAVYRMRGVYVSGEGVVFNRSTVFLRAGCQDGIHRLTPPSFAAGQHEVKRVREVLNWAYFHAENFYHGTIENIHVFITAASVLALHARSRRLQGHSPGDGHGADAGLPVLAFPEQFYLYRAVLAPLLGVPYEHLRRYETGLHDLYHVETLYQTVYQFCGHLSHAYWHDLRRRHLLHPEGVPIFHSDWSPRPTEPLSRQQMHLIPDDWVVVVAQRPGKKRILQETGEIFRQTAQLLPKGRVVLFMGRLPILEARVLFRRCRLFVAGHGAALSNMIFMPSGASVLEIRPRSWDVTCYHSLADACSLKYHLLFSQGNPSRTVSTSVPRVMDVVRNIVRGF